jgi:hypothetical protein
VVVVDTTKSASLDSISRRIGRILPRFLRTSGLRGEEAEGGGQFAIHKAVELGLCHVGGRSRCYRGREDGAAPFVKRRKGFWFWTGSGSDGGIVTL